MRLALLPPLLAAATSALADTLPLARGVYVAQGESCASPPNAVVQTYTGQAIETSKAARCRARVLVRIGNRYTLRQDCVRYGDPSGRLSRAVELVKLRVDSRTRYTDIVHRSGFRLCPGLKL